MGCIYFVALHTVLEDQLDLSRGIQSLCTALAAHVFDILSNSSQTELFILNTSFRTSGRTPSPLTVLFPPKDLAEGTVVSL